MNLNDLKLGILGGGQLGKMLCLAASNWNLDTSVLDPSFDCPSALVATSFYKGDFRDYDDVYRFGNTVDLLTIEIEHVNVEALIKLKENGLEIRPAPEIIALIQNKGKQKEFYASKNLPTADFKIFKNKELILKSIELGELKFPFVQKLCKHGYDGRGVLVVKSEGDLRKLLDGESLIEKLVNIKKEISVMVAQNKKGEIRCFPPVDMVFNSKANLVEFLICPSSLSNEFKSEAISLAEKTIKLLGLCGILAVEMFIDIEDNILINEVAPRPHNSGHHTIEASYTSQYEQCLRAILDLPLGNTDIKVPSVMVNILGDPDYEGKALYEGLENCMKIEGANFHIYGKNETKPYRKMGHVTVLDKELSSAKEKAMFIKKNLRVIANE